MHEPLDDSQTPAPLAAPPAEPAIRPQLFLGGSYDGQHIAVAIDVDIVGLPYRGPVRSLFQQFFESLEGQQYGEVYHRHLLAGDSRAFSVFAPERMGTDEMVAWLIAGYGRPAMDSGEPDTNPT